MVKKNIFFNIIKLYNLLLLFNYIHSNFKEQLLSNKLIISRLKQENLFLLDEIKPEMLKTIKFPKNPKNFNYLSERLPLKNYNVLQCKMVKIEEFLENINGKIIIPNESTKKESIHAQLFPQIENNIAENTPILSKNKELSNEKKIRYKSSFNKKTLKNKKIASPSPMPKYVNHKIGRDFLLKPLNLKNEKIESGRKLFGKNDFHHKEHQENMEIVLSYLFLIQ